MQPISFQIIKAAWITGTLDISAAFIYVFIKTGDPHIPGVLKFIASGIFGKKALEGGAGMMLTGLFLHYLIASLVTIFFFWIFPKLKLLNKIITAILYGMLIWAVMNLVVVPLSQVAHRPINPSGALINIGILIICFGLPLSFMAGRFYNNR
jgi:hypothetical protein